MKTHPAAWIPIACLAVFSAACAAPAGARQMQAQTQTPPQAQWNPLQANKDVEVGTFYLKHGNYEAALDRFEEATRLQPGFALPYLKIGQTYEKMKDWPKAAEAYKSYLEVYKTAPDAKNVRQRIAELEKRMARESPSAPDRQQQRRPSDSAPKPGA